MKDLVIAALVIAGFVITAAAVLLGYLLWLVADYNHGIKKDIEDQSL